MIKIEIHSYFDQGDGLKLMTDTYTVDNWIDMITVLIRHITEHPVLPDEISINFE